MNAVWARCPEWMRTVRFRLTVAYSTLLFALAALVVLGVYAGVSSQVHGQPLSTDARVTGVIRVGDRVVGVRELPASITDIEAAVNARTLEALQRYSLIALAGLFVASMGIGWFLSGRALRPVAMITTTAQEITASDLSRRIRAGGPHDELRRLADTVDAMLDRLDEAFTAQRRLVDDASHELRNPLAIIRTNVDAVLSRDDVSRAERAQASAVVERATMRMSRLVEDLLATARRAAPAFTETDLDLAAVATDAADDFALAAGGKGVTLRRALAPGISVIGDRDALRRAVDNLLSNAVRFTPEGGEVLLATGRSGGWAWVGVRDTGPGIGEAQQGRVFDRFYRAGGPRGAHDGHAGLGLAIVRQIVESHGGRVALHSRVGAGSTFVLWLPLPFERAGAGADRQGWPPAADPMAAPVVSG